jgi:NADPH:quinone reductase-like Zn-dependent oxidoreductase
MKSYTIQTFGIDNLKEVESEIPKCKENEVLVKIHAVSLNYRDYLTIEGLYNPKYKLPLIPCSDGAGEIIEIGSMVQKWKVGDRVIGVFAPDWISGKSTLKEIRNTLGGPNPGTITQYRVFHENALVKSPKNMDFISASTLPCAALTSWSSLFVEGNIKPGEKVLIQGTGGVSLFALQFAKQMGAFVVATTGSDEKVSQLKNLGADFIINYKESPNWGKIARDVSGEGFDHIIEVGGAGTLEQSIFCAKPFAQISLIGVLSGSSGNFNLLPAVMKNIRLQGILVGSKKSLEEMVEFYNQNQIQPVIDKIFNFSEFKESIQYLKTGKHFGKICIRID